ncbi:MAG: serine protease AprX [bacterium]|jgi:serine protease AprX
MNKALLLFCFLSVTKVYGQHSWIYFTDKCSTQIELDDSVCSQYVSTLKSFNVEIIGTSKWFNAACVKGNPQYLIALNFIDRIEPLKHYDVIKSKITQTQAEFSYGNSDWQLGMVGLDSFHALGYTGKGVTIGLFDGGFYKADTVHAFDSLWDNGRIKGYWDFITNDTSIFWEYDGHGKYVLSIVGANWPDSMMGAAPDANFLLARTEDVNTEKRLEEFAWVKAMEWAADLGVDIIHSSLGYSVFDTLQGDYTYEDMDGESTIITRATNIAFTKGIFVTNSAGNQGDDAWHYITAPCDGKHVLCVGAVDSLEQHSAFSSYGPSFDGRVKPEVVAMGEGVTYINNQAHLSTGGGTSFSGPIIAGFVACLMEAWPNITNQQIYDAVIQSADRYMNPDTAYGYGLPNILKADSLLSIFSSTEDFGQAVINFYPNPVSILLTVETVKNMKSYFLSDYLGQQVLYENHVNSNHKMLDCSGQISGFYILTVIMQDGSSFHSNVVIQLP